MSFDSDHILHVHIPIPSSIHIFLTIFKIISVTVPMYVLFWPPYCRAILFTFPNNKFSMRLSKKRCRILLLTLLMKVPTICHPHRRCDTLFIGLKVRLVQTLFILYDIPTSISNMLQFLLLCIMEY
jgi:hypothetical protein